MAWVELGGGGAGEQGYGEECGTHLEVKMDGVLYLRAYLGLGPF